MRQIEMEKELELFFEEHPALSFNDFTLVAKRIYESVDTHRISIYTPIKVKHAKRDINSYDADIKTVETHGIKDLNLAAAPDEQL